jgi:5-formyltetrahydrofolate cyclo-ligase
VVIGGGVGTTGGDVEDDGTARARKAAVRDATRAARRAMTGGERATASELAVTRLRVLPELRRARHVLLYAASRAELDPAGLIGHLRARAVATSFPRVVGDELEAVAAADLRTLELGYRGLSEPTGPAVALEVVDAVLLPGVAFDPVGGRLGQGGGHYDRLLARLPEHTARIGVGFACQLVPRVPREAHDLPVDIIVTDRATYRSRARELPKRR